MSRFTLVDPNTVLFLEQRFGAERTEGDLVALAFKLEGIAGAETKFLAQGFGDHDPPGFVERELGGHIGTLEWENPLLKPIFAHGALIDRKSTRLNSSHLGI